MTASLLRLFEAAAENGGTVCPHPENIEASWVLRNRLMTKDPDGRGGLRAWNASRPPFVEADAVQRAGLFARQTGARLYIVHMSSREALEAGLRARDAGTDIVIETCPHYSYARHRLARRRYRQDQSTVARARGLAKRYGLASWQAT